MKSFAFFIKNKTQAMLIVATILVSHLSPAFANILAPEEAAEVAQTQNRSFRQLTSYISEKMEARYASLSHRRKVRLLKKQIKRLEQVDARLETWSEKKLDQRLKAMASLSDSRDLPSESSDEITAEEAHLYGDFAQEQNSRIEWTVAETSSSKKEILKAKTSELKNRLQVELERLDGGRGVAEAMDIGMALFLVGAALVVLAIATVLAPWFAIVGGILFVGGLVVGFSGESDDLYY